MQGLILLTAMTATGGLFGGGKTACAPRGHQVGHHCAMRSACGTAPMAAPVQYAPAPQALVAPTGQQVYAAPVASVSYNSFYSGGCATGNCPRR
jgi:hypothetical protein